VGEQQQDLMENDQTPINAQPERQRPEALEDLSLALRDRLLWPAADYFRSFSDAGRVAAAGGAVVLALGLGVGGYSLASSDGGEQAAAPVALTRQSAPVPAPVKAEPRPEPEPTLQGATPVFEATGEPASPKAAASSAEAGDEAPVTTAANSGNPATDTISSSPAARAATASTSNSPLSAAPDGRPAGPAAIAVARKFAEAFVVYEIGDEETGVRKAFKATATPEVVRALMQRPPRQPAGVKVPKAKVLNVVPAPSHDRIYPVSVSLLRVGATSELRLEMEQLKNKQWRVVNVLG
jgi:hypothetical protein